MLRLLLHRVRSQREDLRLSSGDLPGDGSDDRARLAAGLGKFGAFIFPLMLSSAAFKLPGAMGFAAAICAAGFLLTFLLPEPNQKSLETIEEQDEKAEA